MRAPSRTGSALRQLVALRADLVGLLAGEPPGGVLHTGVTVTGADPGGPDRPARVATSDGELTADLVVAADGIGSVIRQSLFPDHPGPQIPAWRHGGSSPRRQPPARAGRAGRDLGRGAVFGAVPLADGMVYCYASAPHLPGGAARPGSRTGASVR